MVWFGAFLGQACCCFLSVSAQVTAKVTEMKQTTLGQPSTSSLLQWDDSPPREAKNPEFTSNLHFKYTDYGSWLASQIKLSFKLDLICFLQRTLWFSFPTLELKYSPRCKNGSYTKGCVNEIIPRVDDKCRAETYSLISSQNNDTDGILI